MQRLHLLALNPTDSVTEGFLPAAARLGLAVTLLTDRPAAHRRAYRGDPPPALEIVHCEVGDFREVIGRISAMGPPPDAVFSNSDHLQVQTALAADYFGLPGKDWRAALRAKNKAQLRRALAAAGQDAVRFAELPPDHDPQDILDTVPFPCVLKPREGVASEDVVLVEEPARFAGHCAAIRERRPGEALVAEEYLDGPLFTLETLGDGRTLHTLGSFRTRLSPPPYFTERRLDLLPRPQHPHADRILEQLRALGIGFGACHTEYTVHRGRARLIEVNYRAIGDHCDLTLAHALRLPLFELILRTHLGEPLPGQLGACSGGRVRIEYVCAERGGTLRTAPGPSDIRSDGVRLVYRPLRQTGERHPLYRTNRDYLGVIRATGTDQDRIDRAVRRFLASRRWEIE
ncbi:acetyl-CoA carboxylase biotin carboxylase subunit family protein [Streptomyces sp. NPDC052396]|uniref:acetyl-CoA carboxylase biotin carboxylase subunit family protein n=1 Tax=Streptomyces sp. NPDC052396 TaxID=3365689 RepID=UPI0037D41C06